MFGGHRAAALPVLWTRTMVLPGVKIDASSEVSQ